MSTGTRMLRFAGTGLALAVTAALAGSATCARADDAALFEPLADGGVAATSDDGAGASQDDVPDEPQDAAGGSAADAPAEGAPGGDEPQEGADGAYPPADPEDPASPEDPANSEDPAGGGAEEEAPSAPEPDVAARSDAVDATGSEVALASEEAPAHEGEGTRFSLVELGLITPVQNQWGWNICWSFASMASLESSVLRTSGVSMGLSPFHAAFFMVTGDEEHEYATSGNPYITPDPYVGNGSVTTLVGSLAAGKGAVQLIEYVNDWGDYDIDPSLRMQHAVRLTDSIQLYTRAAPFWETPDPEERVDLIKYLVETYGPVVISTGASTDGPNFNAEHSCFYAPADAGVFADHDIVIVGWDDAYPRENFNEWMRPENNGAWLIKNSWGTDSGEDGYFWVSYEDMYVAECVLMGEVARSGECTYQTDEIGWCNSMTLDGSTGAYMANVFTSERDETLDRVMFATTGRDASYSIDVYLNPTDPYDPTSGELVSSQEGWQTWPGYHTVALETPVSLGKGDTFSIVMHVDNATYPWPVAVETFVPDPELEGYTPTYMGYDDAGNPEVSLVSADGASWENPTGYGNDLAILADRSFVTNACVKALTMPRESPDPEPVPDPDPDPDPDPTPDPDPGPDPAPAPDPDPDPAPAPTPDPAPSSGSASSTGASAGSPVPKTADATDATLPAVLAGAGLSALAGGVCAARHRAGRR